MQQGDAVHRFRLDLTGGQRRAIAGGDRAGHGQAGDLEHVADRRSGDAVGEAVGLGLGHRHRVAAAAGQVQRLDTGQRHAGDVDRGRGFGDLPLGIGDVVGTDAQRVVAGPAVERHRPGLILVGDQVGVVAGAALDDVGLRLAVARGRNLAGHDEVVAGTATDGVHAPVADQRVVAVAAVHQIVAVAAHDEVVAGFAEQLVIVGAAENLVVPATAMDGVVAVTALQRVVAGPAELDVVAVMAPEPDGIVAGHHPVVEVGSDPALDVDEGVARSLTRAVGRGCKVEHDSRRGVLVSDGVEARPAVQHVGTGAAVEGVVAGAAHQGVVAETADEGVIADPSYDGIVARHPVDGVADVVTGQRVVARRRSAREGQQVRPSLLPDEGGGGADRPGDGIQRPHPALVRMAQRTRGRRDARAGGGGQPGQEALTGFAGRGVAGVDVDLATGRVGPGPVEQRCGVQRPGTQPDPSRLAMGNQMHGGRPVGKRRGQNGVSIVGGGHAHDLDVLAPQAEQLIEILKPGVRDDDFGQGKHSLDYVWFSGGARSHRSRTRRSARRPRHDNGETIFATV